jgi:hypothetical protein
MLTSSVSNATSSSMWPEVAEAAVFLASDGAVTITGAVIDLTCGNAVRTRGGMLVGVLD